MKKKSITIIILLIGSFAMLTAFVSKEEKPPVPPFDQKAVEASAIKGFKLLQTSGAIFITKAHCASCHHATMTSMVAATLQKKGINSIDTTSIMREMAETATLDIVANPNLNNQFVAAKFLAPYVLLGLSAGQHAPDFTTDNAVNYIISQALPDGHFQAEYSRVPFEYGDIHLTAISIRSIAAYAPQLKSPRIQSLISRTRQWLISQHTSDQQELSFQLLGLHWSGGSMNDKQVLARQLMSIQNKDGGWSQLPTMQSDAYATGESLYALLESGAADSNNETIRKAIDYLIRTQDNSGAWTVKTRSSPIQPFVNSEFPPYDDNQFISAAASNWASLALATALPDKQQ